MWAKVSYSITSYEHYRKTVSPYNFEINLNTCTSKIMPNLYKPTSCTAWTNCSLYLAICSTSTSKQQERQLSDILWQKQVYNVLFSLSYKCLKSCPPNYCHLTMFFFINFWQLRGRVTHLWKLSDNFCLIW